MKRGSNSPSSDNKKQRQLDGFFRASSTATAATTSTDETPITISKYKIFCDLDGVLVDFDMGVRQLLNGKGPDDVNSAQLWGSISKADSFYTHLPWMSDAKQLWEELKALPHVDILTGVPMNKKSRGEKFAWCKRELGLEVNHLDMAGTKSKHEVVSGRRKKGVVNVITCWSKNKHFESRENHVLIDDRLKLKVEWEKQGGTFVHHVDAESTLTVLREMGILSEK
ncbi:hypothetical protein ACHAWO_009571 [Cyclotella atomus]|jgi:hypothetical protein|uniref:Uncharacterized protein n=1 Tax=Cyclotella atomus TaxID=382360 RepID=A0ABD3N6T3_9STRA